MEGLLFSSSHLEESLYPFDQRDTSPELPRENGICTAITPNHAHPAMIGGDMERHDCRRHNDSSSNPNALDCEAVMSKRRGGPRRGIYTHLHMSSTGRIPDFWVCRNQLPHQEPEKNAHRAEPKSDLARLEV